MKKIFVLTLLLFTTVILNAQESTEVYKNAVQLIKNTPAYQNLNRPELSASAQTISFTNQAYAFWLDGMDTRFKNKNFENFFGELYQPIKIKNFRKVRHRRRSKYQLYVSETENNLFVIELLSRKRKQKSKYPEFYQGNSTSFLFEKLAANRVRLIETLRVQNN